MLKQIYLMELTVWMGNTKVININIISSLLFQLMHFTISKTLKSHTKTLKIRPYMFQSPLKPSSGGPWLYFARLLNWNIDLHLL
jgi:hypothetical protein